MKLKTAEYLTILALIFSLSILLSLNFNSNCQTLPAISFDREQIKVFVRKGKKNVWSGRVKKGILVEELLSQIKIEHSAVFERDKRRVLTRNGSVVHIRA